MKLLVLVSLLGLVACRQVPLYPRIEELVRSTKSVKSLYNETLLLISVTEQLMTRMAVSGRVEVDLSIKNISSTLDSLYQYTANRTSTLATYLLDEIETLEVGVTDLETCLSLVPSVANLSQVFDDQYKVVIATSHYVANVSLENKYTGLMQNIAHVRGLTPSLAKCNLSESCIVDIANQVEEQNLALMDGIADIYSSSSEIYEAALNTANSSAAITVYVNEEYICNVALIIEDCIQSRIDNPIATTTPSGQVTSPISVSTEATTPTKEAVTTQRPGTSQRPRTSQRPGTTSRPGTTKRVETLSATTINPSVYCTHATFSP